MTAHSSRILGCWQMTEGGIVVREAASGSAQWVQKCHKPSRHRIAGTGGQESPPAFQEERHPRRYPQPSPCGHTNGSDTCTIRWGDSMVGGEGGW
jgi:hypothetical protein